MSFAISIIIPTNKPTLYLADCLNSLARQTIDNHLFEVIVVINGSSFDEFIKCCKTWNDSRNNIFFRFIYERQGGVSRARNIGLDHALGAYIAFIDDDDVVSTSYLEDLYENVNATQIAVANVRCFDKDIHDYYSDYLGLSFIRLKCKSYSILTYRSFLSICCAKLIPTLVIGDIRFNESIHMGEDSLFMASISYKIESIRLTDEKCIYNRRVTNNSLSRGKKDIRYLYQQRIMLIIHYIKIWIKHPFDINLLFIFSRIIAAGLHLIRKT